MAAKRSRLGRSSSSCDTTVLPPPIFDSKEIRSPISLSIRPPSPAISIPAKNRPAIAIPAKNRPAIFMISSSSVGDSGDTVSVSQELGSFLDKCGFCRKSLAEDDEVFMYSTLRAFCTLECRQKQIDINKDMEKPAAKPKRKGTGKRAGF